MSLLLDQFLDVLETIPDVIPKPEAIALHDRFSHNRLFVCHIKHALDRAGVGETQFFDGWLSSARNVFMSRNIPGILRIEKFSLYG